MNDTQQKKQQDNLLHIGKIKVTKKEKVNHSGSLCFVMSMVWNIQNNLSHLKSKCILITPVS